MILEDLYLIKTFKIKNGAPWGEPMGPSFFKSRLTRKKFTQSAREFCPRRKTFMGFPSGGPWVPSFVKAKKKEVAAKPRFFFPGKNLHGASWGGPMGPFWVK